MAKGRPESQDLDREQLSYVKTTEAEEQTPPQRVGGIGGGSPGGGRPGDGYDVGEPDPKRPR